MMNIIIKRNIFLYEDNEKNHFEILCLALKNVESKNVFQGKTCMPSASSLDEVNNCNEWLSFPDLIRQFVGLACHQDLP